MFSWLLGSLSELNPKFTKEILIYGVEYYDDITIKDFDRVLAKQYYFNRIELAETLETELINLFFESLNNPNLTTHSAEQLMRALNKTCQKNVELRSELSSTIELLKTKGRPFNFERMERIIRE